VEHWAGVPCLGVLPEVELAGSEPSDCVVKAPDASLAVAVKALHTTILAAHPQARVIALASALPADGKTTTSVALARQSAVEGLRTVLVDCDLRRRSSTAVLGSPPKLGLLDVVYGRCSLDEALVCDPLTPLAILPVVADLEVIARATNRDMFASAEMLALMSELRRRYDHVFLDTPPLLALVDARRLAPLADVFLLLARWRSTPRRAIRNAIDLLSSTPTPIAGLVLTRARFPPDSAPASGA
jgi:polysaccharide biosynthesis transport protein